MYVSSLPFLYYFLIFSLPPTLSFYVPLPLSHSIPFSLPFSLLLSLSISPSLFLGGISAERQKCVWPTHGCGLQVGVLKSVWCLVINMLSPVCVRVCLSVCVRMCVYMCASAYPCVCICMCVFLLVPTMISVTQRHINGKLSGETDEERKS